MNKKEYICNFTHNTSWLRKQNNLSKKKMSEILGISTKTLSQIEQGIMPPRLKVDTIYRMEDYFSIPLKTLLEVKLI